MATVLQICRICLRVNVKMYILKNTDVKNVYKLLMQAYVYVEDGKPTTVCFLCYARLQQCNRLQQQAIKSNELLEQLPRGGFMEATGNSILNNQYTSQLDLQLSSIYHLSCEPATCRDVFLDQNVEANSQISVKEENEATDEGYNMTDFSEDANDTEYFDPEDDQPLIIFHKSNEINEVVHEKKWRKLQEKENLCKEKSEIEVKNKPPPSSLILMQPKQNVSENNEEADGIHIKSKIKLDKSIASVVTMEHNFQKPINNNESTEETTINLKKKMEKTKTTFVPKKLDIQKRINDKDTQKTNTDYKFQCNECRVQFSTKAILIHHIPKCMKTTEISLNNSLLMKENMLKSLLPKMYSCDICTFETIRKRAIEKHLKMHNVTKFFYCEICEYRSVNKAQLRKHIITHAVEKPYSCNICEYRSAHKSNLNKHMRTHTGEKSFSCIICEYRCSQKHHLKHHIWKHTGEKPFSCNICEYRFVQKYHLENHMRTHTGEKPFSCNICEYRCLQKHRLKEHLRTHTGEKPFSCNICEYRCAYKPSLKTHMRTHTGEKPFSCNICEYRCASKTGLNMHMRTHTGEKPFSCNICDYRCTQKVRLKLHIKIHTGEKSLSCNICKYTCVRKCDLNRHITMHTGEKPFSCNICEYRCANKFVLKKHMRKHN